MQYTFQRHLSDIMRHFDKTRFAQCSRITIWVPTKEGIHCSVPNIEASPYYNGKPRKQSIFDGLNHKIMKIKHSKSYERFDVNGDRIDRNQEISIQLPDQNGQIGKNHLKVEIPQQTEPDKELDITTENNDCEEILNKIFKEFKVTPKILRSYDNNFLRFSFYLENYRIESLVWRLHEKGIGSTENTSVSVIPASMHLEVAQDKKVNRYCYYNSRNI